MRDERSVENDRNTEKNPGHLSPSRQVPHNHIVS
jgi:hypothetical protein